MQPVLLYTLARFAVFLATAGVLFLLGARSFLLVLLSLVISGVISFVLLTSRRDAMSSAVQERVVKSKRKIEESRTKEDPAPKSKPSPKAREES